MKCLDKFNTIGLSGAAHRARCAFSISTIKIHRCFGILRLHSRPTVATFKGTSMDRPCALRAVEKGEKQPSFFVKAPTGEIIEQQSAPDLPALQKVNLV